MASTYDQRPLARLSSPGEVAAVIPTLVGFVPSESVVVVVLRGPSRRVALTLRIDLPASEHEALLVQQLAARLARVDAAAAVIVVYTDGSDQGGARPRQALVTAVVHGLGLLVVEALLVRRGRWWSYLCADPTCCPPAGTPADATPTSALRLIGAETALAGRSVLASRTDLVRSVAAPVGEAASSARRHLQRAAHASRVAGDEQSPAQRRRAAVQGAKDLLEASAGRRAVLGADMVAAFAVAISDVVIRDEVATWALDRAEDLLTLLLQAARQVVPPYDAPICTLLAWVAYAGGDGGLANVALDRALDTAPDYVLAQLLRSALDGQVPPAEVRRLLRATRRRSRLTT